MALHVMGFTVLQITDKSSPDSQPIGLKARKLLKI